MSPAVKNGLLLVALVAIVGAAVFFFTKGDKETALPTEGAKTEWMCDTCQKEYLLSPAQLDEWTKGDRKRRDPNYPGGYSVFRCDDCQKYSIVRADVGPDGKMIIWTDSQGKPVPHPELDK